MDSQAKIQVFRPLSLNDEDRDPGEDPSEAPGVIEIQAKILVETFRHPDQIQVLMLVLLQEQFSRT